MASNYVIWLKNPTYGNFGICVPRKGRYCQHPGSLRSLPFAPNPALSGFSCAANKENPKKIFSSLLSLDQIRGSPLDPMLREIVIRMLGHFEYNPKDDGFVMETTR